MSPAPQSGLLYDAVRFAPPDMRKPILFILCLISFTGCFLAAVPAAFAEVDEEKRFLLMYFKEEELVVETATRSPKSITQTAENMTVITADDIKLMNAHTVADVLNTVTGVQVFNTGGPGSIATASIQGSDNRHVTVFMDGIPLNNLSDNVVDLGVLSVRNIEKIEIVKGPASSAWGSALGGVINIITKSGKEDASANKVSASYGEKRTGDFSVETSGKQDRFGYYLTAGRLLTDGFRPNNDFSGNNVYAKLTYDVTEKTRVVFTAGYDKIERGDVELPDFDFSRDNTVETSNSSVSLYSVLTTDMECSVSLWQLHQDYAYYNYQISTDTELSNDRYQDKTYGAAAKLAWKYRRHNIVVGTDFDSARLTSNTITEGYQSIKKQALYINDTVTWDRLSVTPGIRHDITDTNGEFTSPSLGLTYKISETTLLRAYTAQAFSVPKLADTYGNNFFHTSNPDIDMERVWSSQLGAESTALQHLWLKLSVFRHEVRDGIIPENLPDGTFTSVNGGKQRRQGMEVEMKTTPLYHTSLVAGAAFMRSKDLNTGETIPNIPQKTYDVGLQYDDNSLKAALKGHYIYWNSDPAFNGKYDSFIFDLHVSNRIFSHNRHALDVFGSVHNIFDDSQYAISVYTNPSRWLEAGIRYTF
jgi:vitamin B12 transporter